MPCDPSALFLVLSNIVTIVVAVHRHWHWAEVMWIYWGQSVVICYFAWRKICKLKPLPRAAAALSRRFELGFYAFIFGFPLALYAFFLGFASGNLTGQELYGMVGCVALFAGNHYFSYRRNLEQDLARRPTAGALAAFPFVRLLPMHLTVALGLGSAARSTGMLVLFLCCKTLADVGMHLVEHREHR